MKKLIIIIFTLIFLSACSINEKKVEFEELEINEFVLSCGKNFPYEESHVINSFEELETKGCEILNKSKIDFETKTLLGQIASAGGCGVEFNKIVTINEKDKILKYTINTKVKDSKCQVVISAWNWILVPKISDDYNILFEVK